MLLSRQGLPVDEIGGPNDFAPAFARLVSIVAPPLSPGSLVGASAAEPPIDAADSEITPLNWVAAGTPTPASILGDGSAAIATAATITVQGEPVEPGPILDPITSTGPDEAPSVDAPILMTAPAWEGSPQGSVFDGLDELDEIPWRPDYSVAATLDAGRSQIAYRIPVGPDTSALRLAVRFDRPGPGPSPLIDKLYLVNPAGGVLGGISTAAVGVGDDGQRFLVTLRGAPDGSHLVVCLTTRDGPTSTAPGDGSEGAPAPAFAMNFELSIQRSDPEPASAAERGVGGSVAAAPSPPHSITVPAGLGFAAWAGAASARLPLDAPARAERSENGGGALAGSFSWAMPAGRSPSVYLGPLVFRGASPLGPTLATSEDEPTQLIDREGLAVDQAIDQISAELDSELLAGLKNRDGATATATETRALAGAGGLPVLVTATVRARKRADADALAANLQSRSVEEALNAEAPKAPPTADPGIDDVRIASAGVITRAAGLIIGLGLATGPLYPDLVALARRKLAWGKGSILKPRRLFRRRPIG